MHAFWLLPKTGVAELARLRLSWLRIVKDDIASSQFRLVDSRATRFVQFRGRSDEGVYRYLYPPKSAQVNFLWGKNDVRTAIQQFYTPKKLLYPPKNKFLATPLVQFGMAATRGNGYVYMTRSREGGRGRERRERESRACGKRRTLWKIV